MEDQIQTQLKALEESPGNPEALTALESIYSQSESWEPLAKLLEENAQRLASGERSPDLFLRAAVLYGERLTRVDKAERCLRRVLDFEPGNRDALDRLAALLRGSERFDEVTGLLERLVASAVDDQERARRLEELGVILDDKLAQPERALVALQAAFQADRGAKSALQRGVEIYERLERHEMAKGLLDLLLEVADGEDDAKLLADQFSQVAHKLLLRPSRHDVARDAVNKTLALVPDNKDALELKQRLEEYPSNWEEHVRSLRDGAMGARDKNTAAGSYLSIAEHYWIYGEDADRAEEFADKAFLLVPGYWPAVRFLERMCRKAGRVPQLLERLGKMATEITDVRTAVDLYLLIALLEAEAGAERARLAEIYGKVISIDAANKSACTALVELHVDAGEPRPAAEALARYAREVRDPAERSGAHLQAARLFATELDDAVEAIKHFEAVRELDKESVEAVSALEELYGKAGRPAEQANLLEWRVEHSDDRAERLALHDRLASLYAGELDDPLLAFQAGRRAYELDPRSDREAELERLADSLARPGELAGTFHAAIEGVSDPGEQQRLLLRVAELANLAQQPQLAREALGKVLNADPENADALIALESLSVKGEDARSLAEALEARLGAVKATKERRSLLLRLARLYAQELRESGKAIDRFRALIELDPNDEDALDALDGLLRREERWRELGGVLEKRVEQSSGEAATVFKLRLAKLYEDRLDKPRESLDLYEELHGDDPERLDIVAALERLLTRGIEPLRVAGVLQPHYASVGAHRRHVDMIEIRRQATEDAKQRCSLSREIARILEEELRAPREAFDAMGAALLDDPGDPEIPRDLDRLAEAAGTHDQLAQVLEKASAALPESPAKVALEARRAAILESRLGDDTAAIDAHRKLLRQNPGNLESLNALIGLLERGSLHAELAEWLEVKRQFVPDEEKPAVDERIGQLFADQLDDADKALAAFERARATDDARVRERVLVRLDMIYREAEVPHKLLSVLQEREALAVGTERAEISARMGELLHKHADEPEDALESFRHAVEIDARNQRAIDGLSALLADAELDAAPRVGAAKLLEPLRRADDDSEGLAEVLRVRLTGATEIDERRELVNELGNLTIEELDDLDAALDLLTEHLLVDPEDEQGFKLVETLAIAAGEVGRLLSLMQRVVDADGPAAEAYGRRLVAIATERGELDAARAALVKLLERNPDEQSLHAQLVKLTRESDDADVLGQALLAQAKAAQPEQAKGLLSEAAEVFVGGEQYEAAIDALRYHLVTFGFELNVADRVAALLTTLERHAEVGGLWHEGLKVVDEAQKPEIALRLGGVLLGPLENPGAAVKTLSVCLQEVAPAELCKRAVSMLDFVARSDNEARNDARIALADHYRRVEAVRPLIDVLEKIAEELTDQGERAALFDEIGGLRDEKLGEATLAFAAASRAFRAAPTAERQERLRDLAGRAESDEAYLGLLEEMADERAEQETEAAVALLHEAAKVAGEKLSDRATRVKLLQKVLELAPGEPVALQALEDAHRSAAETGQLVKVLMQKAQATEDADERFENWRQVARILVDEGNFDHAVSTLRKLRLDYPDRHEVLADLDTALSRAGDHQGLADVLSRRIDLEPDTSKRGVLATRLGRTHLALGQLREALDALWSASADAPKDPSLAAALGELLERAKETGTPPPVQVAEVLETVLRAVGSTEDLPPVLEIRLQAATEASARQEVLLEIAHIQETVLGQGTLAFMSACRGLREVPGNAEAMDRVARVARRTGSEEELVFVLEEILDMVEEPAIEARLRARLAEVLEETNAGVSEVLPHLEQAHLQAPDDLEIAEALVRVGRGQLVSRAMASALGKVAAAAAVAGDSERAKELWLEAAELHEEVEEVDRAVADLESILDLDERDLPALRSLDRLYERLERTDDLIRVLEREIAVAAGQQKGEFMLRLAEQLRTAKAHPLAAAAMLEQIAIELPDAVGLVGALEEVSVDLSTLGSHEAGETRARIAELLAPRYEGSGEVGKLVEILEARLEGLTEVGERRSLLLRIAKLRSVAMGQPELGFIALTRALRESPDNDALRDSVENAAEDAGEFAALVDLYENIADSDVANWVGLGYRRRLAELCRDRLEKPARALQHLEAALRLLGDPEEAKPEQRAERLELLHAIEDLARESEDLEVLARTLAQLAEAEEDADFRRQARLELARLQIGLLSDLRAGLETVKTLLELDADDVVALDIAIEATEQLARYEDQVEYLRHRISLTTDPAEALAQRFRLARMLDEGLERREDADAEFKAILEDDAGHAVTRAYLEERVGKRADRGASVEVLEGAYAKTGDWNKAIEVLEGQVREAEKRKDSAAARALLLRIGELHARELDSPELAFSTLTRALKGERGEDELRKRLCDLARELELLDDLAELFEENAQNAADTGRPDVEAEILESTAAIYAFDLDDPDKGLALYEQVLTKHPGRIETLAGLDRLYEKIGRYEDLEKVLRKRLALSEEDDERAGLFHRLGLVLADHLGRESEAINTFEKVLEIDPKHAVTRATLAELYVGVGDNVKLRGVLESLLEDALEVEDKAEERRLRVLLARLLSGEIDEPAIAIEHWEQVLLGDPSSEEAKAALEELYPKASRFEDLKALLEKELTVATDSARQAELSTKLGGVLAELDDYDLAIARFEKVLDGDPRNKDALEALRKIYRSMGRHEDLVGVLRRLLRLQADATGVKAIRFDLAEVLGGPLDRRADAVEAGRRVLDVEPHTAEELQRLEAIFRACEAWEECAETLDRRADLVEGPEQQIPILYEMAALWEGPIGRREAAARAYERILAVDPGDEVAHRALGEIYTNTDEWRKLVALKESRLPTVEYKPDRIALLKEICEIYELRLAQKDFAFLAACRAFREDVLDRECGDWMERLAVETDSTEELLDVYDDEVQRVGDEMRAIEIYLRMADLAANRLNDFEVAEAQLNRVFEYDAENRSALDQLFSLYEKQERFEDAITVIERKIDIAEDLESKKSLLFRICNVFEEHLERPQDAVDGFKRVLELDGSDRRAINNLARLYEELERYQALVGILQRAVETEDDLAEQVALRFRIAGIWENELDNLEQAIATHRNILEIDPSHALSLKALERVYTQLDRMSELLGVYEKQVALATSVDEQVRLLTKIGTIWEDRFDNVEQAVAATERVLLISPTNEGAIKTLERLFKQTANWQRLIDVMRQHIELTKDAEEIVDLYLEVGEVFYKELNRADKAEEMYLAAMDHNPKSRRAIHALGQLYERSGNWFNALEKLALEADLLGADPESVEIHFRMGKINEDMLLDAQSARASYERALDLDPSYLPAVKALKTIHYAAREFEEYLKYLTLEAEHVDDVEEKTELFTEAARFMQDRNADLDGAVEFFEAALRHTPDHLPAAQPLAEIEFRRENYERTRELIEVITENLDPVSELADLVRQNYRLGYVNQKLGQEAEALRAFQRSFELDSTYLPALEGYGQALVQAQMFDQAQQVYQTLLINHRDNLTDAEVVDYYWQLGEIGRQLDQNERALRSLSKALELDPAHAPSLKLVGDIQEAEGEFEEAYDAFNQLAGLLGGDDRVEMLLHVGKLSQTKLTDPYRAIDAYEDAHRLRSGDKQVLEALYDLYRETRQGPRAAEALEELVGVEEDENTRVRLNFTLGEIYRDELKNDARSVQYFNAALDLNPTFMSAFEAIEKLLASRKQWQLLEENYRAMIQRTPKENVKVRAILWSNLAELYLRVLKQPEAAVYAYQVLCRLDPDNPKYIESLAEILARIPAKVDEAIGTYQTLVPLAEDPGQALHALRRLYLQRQMHDRAYCACSSLRVLRQADQEEQQLYAYYHKHAPQKAQRALTERLWDALLVHDKAKGHLATVAALLFRHAARELLEDPKDLGIGKRREWDRVDSTRYFVSQLKYVRDVLNTAPVELLQKRRSESVLTVLPIPMLTIGIGEHNDLFKEVPPRHIWFVAARVLTYTRPTFLIPFILGPQDFAAAFEAALLFVEPRFQGRAEPEAIQRYSRRLAKVREPLSGALRTVFKKILAERKRPDVMGFFEGIELTAIRTAHLMCADIDISTQMLRAKDPGHYQIQYRAKMQELLNYIVSEPYYELRSRLGLAIKSQAQ